MNHKMIRWLAGIAVGVALLATSAGSAGATLPTIDDDDGVVNTDGGPPDKNIIQGSTGPVSP